MGKSLPSERAGPSARRNAPAMKTLNDEFDRYRDCLRLVWNYALQGRSPGDDAFAQLSSTLLKLLVLDRLASPSSAGRSEMGYVPGLGISMATDNVEMLFPQETDSDIVWNRVAQTVPEGSILFYQDVMDFRDGDGMVDLDFVKGVAQGTTAFLKVGATFAVRRSDVDIVDLTS